MLESLARHCNIQHKIPGNCVLRETGLSVTRPARDNIHLGEGMEFHSDGAQGMITIHISTYPLSLHRVMTYYQCKGEYTMLMSFADVSAEQGALCLHPNSHLQFKTGIGHGDLDQQKLCNTCEKYMYRSGEPVIIDARTLHGVTSNISSHWRFVAWFIYDMY